MKYYSDIKSNTFVSVLMKWIPGLGRSAGEVKGYPLQHYGLENSMDYIVHEVAKSRTRLSDFHFSLMKWMSLEPIIQSEVRKRNINIIY